LEDTSRPGDDHPLKNAGTGLAPFSAAEDGMKKTLGTVVVMMLMAAPALAKHGHQKKFEICYLQPHDVRIVREYYEPRYRSLPPGLAKKQARTGELPPGWAKKIQPLPVVVERQLVVLPPDYRRGYIDGSIVVYSPRTHVVVDVATVFGR
jgi:hypothetical protein